MLAFACCAAVLAAPPNIITILTADDQGFGDSSYNCENSTGMCALTPNLDVLALSPHSALFSRFYAAGGAQSGACTQRARPSPLPPASLHKAQSALLLPLALALFFFLAKLSR